MDQRSGDGRISGRSQDVAVNHKKHGFPNFDMLDAKIASVLKNKHPEVLLQEKRQSGGAKGPIGRSISSWKTDCVHDLRILPGDWRS